MPQIRSFYYDSQLQFVHLSLVLLRLTILGTRLSGQISVPVCHAQWRPKSERTLWETRLLWFYDMHRYLLLWLHIDVYICILSNLLVCYQGYEGSASSRFKIRERIRLPGIRGVLEKYNYLSVFILCCKQCMALAFPDRRCLSTRSSAVCNPHVRAVLCNDCFLWQWLRQNIWLHMLLSPVCLCHYKGTLQAGNTGPCHRRINRTRFRISFNLLPRFRSD